MFLPVMEAGEGDGSAVAAVSLCEAARHRLVLRHYSAALSANWRHIQTNKSWCVVSVSAASLLLLLPEKKHNLFQFINKQIAKQIFDSWLWGEILKPTFNFISPCAKNKIGPSCCCTVLTHWGVYILAEFWSAASDRPQTLEMASVWCNDWSNLDKPKIGI